MRFNTLTILSFLASAVAHADLAWIKSSKDPVLAEVPVSGVFLKTSVESAKKITCPNGLTTYAWVSKRLTATTKLTAKDGEVLGRRLSRAMAKSCVSGVELDYEPMPVLASWFVEFCAGVRKTLSPKWKLHVAIPVVSENAIPGPFWSAKDAHAVLAVVDAVDIMLYDTGSVTSAEYEKLVRDNVAFAIQAKKLPKKQVVLGFPGYQDKTMLHKAQIENLSAVLTVMRSLNEADRNALCSDEIDFAYFATYAMNELDKEAARDLIKWRGGLCRKK